MSMKFQKGDRLAYAFVNDGMWSSVIEWLDSLAPSGRFTIPFGHRPPIVVGPTSGTLNVWTGRKDELAKVGDVILFDEQNGFAVTDLASLEEKGWSRVDTPSDDSA